MSDIYNIEKAGGPVVPANFFLLAPIVLYIQAHFFGDFLHYCRILLSGKSQPVPQWSPVLLSLFSDPAYAVS